MFWFKFLKSKLNNKHTSHTQNHFKNPDLGEKTRLVATLGDSDFRIFKQGRRI